jgi:hypothetical protein
VLIEQISEENTNRLVVIAMVYVALGLGRMTIDEQCRITVAICMHWVGAGIAEKHN